MIPISNIRSHYLNFDIMSLVTLACWHLDTLDIDIIQILLIRPDHVVTCIFRVVRANSIKLWRGIFMKFQRAVCPPCRIRRPFMSTYFENLWWSWMKIPLKGLLTTEQWKGTFWKQKSTLFIVRVVVNHKSSIDIWAVWVSMGSFAKI